LKLNHLGTKKLGTPKNAAFKEAAGDLLNLV
jgi:hypothetical protein